MTLSANGRRRLKQALIQANALAEIGGILDGLVNSVVIDETLTLTNAVSRAMTAQIPVGAVITGVAVNLETAVDGDNTNDNLLARIGLGITGTVAKYGQVTTLTRNSKLTRIPAHAVLTAAETLTLFALKTDNTAATERFAAGGRVRVRVTYATGDPLPDA
jgi:hypothetical protein